MKLEKPADGQESVWDYPRPPRLEAAHKRIRIVCGGLTLVDSTNALRMLETSHPPVYYIPIADIQQQYVQVSQRVSWCEWKGQASYFHLQLPEQTIADAGWFYSNPSPIFANLRNHYAFYASKMDACYVDDELARPQEGDFYGGWISSQIVGPFKGGPGTRGW